MKRTKIYFTILTLLIFSAGLMAQETFQKVSMDRAYYFDSKTKTAEIIVEITDEFNYLSVAARSEILEGKLSVEIVDPKGKTQGKYEVGDCTESENLAEVRGNMSKQFPEPMNGKWKVKIIAKNCKGTIRTTTTKDLLAPEKMYEMLIK